MDFPVMVEDLLAWLDRRGLHRIDLPGHSMGGKLAMAFVGIPPSASLASPSSPPSPHTMRQQKPSRSFLLDS